MSVIGLVSVIGLRTHSSYALLLYKPDATRAAIGALSEIQLAEALMDLVSAPDTEKRHAYIRNLVREQNEGSTLNHPRLDPLGQADQNSNDSSSEESEYEVQISVGFDGTVKHTRAKRVHAKKMTLEERLRAEMREAMSAQGRAVTDDWMERPTEKTFWKQRVLRTRL